MDTKIEVRREHVVASQVRKLEFTPPPTTESDYLGTLEPLGEVWERMSWEGTFQIDWDAVEEHSPIWEELRNELPLPKTTVDQLVDKSTRKLLALQYENAFGAKPSSRMSKRDIATAIVDHEQSHE